MQRKRIGPIESCWCWIHLTYQTGYHCNEVSNNVNLGEYEIGKWIVQLEGHCKGTQWYIITWG